MNKTQIFAWSLLIWQVGNLYPRQFWHWYTTALQLTSFKALLKTELHVSKCSHFDIKKAHKKMGTIVLSKYNK